MFACFFLIFEQALRVNICELLKFLAILWEQIIYALPPEAEFWAKSQATNKFLSSFWIIHGVYSLNIFHVFSRFSFFRVVVVEERKTWNICQKYPNGSELIIRVYFGILYEMSEMLREFVKFEITILFITADVKSTTSIITSLSI